MIGKRVATIAILVSAPALLAACASGSSSSDSSSSTAASAASSSSEASAPEASPSESSDASGAPVRVALVGNQRFGDQGPMDDMKKGLEQCAADFGYETKTFESIETAGQEDDIRALADDGYNLIFTTFPPMTPATLAVATDFPDTDFGAVYQFINVDGTSVPNVWDTEYRGDSAYYIAGAAAATLSKSGTIGMVAGAEDPTIDAAINAWEQGAMDTKPGTKVEYAFAGSYEDPAKGKEIASAMAERGVDVITTAAAKTQLGVLDAAKEAGILFIGDVADNSAQAPKSFVTFVGSSFGNNIYEGCKEFHDGTFQGGKHTFQDLTNGGYSVPTDPIAAWGTASGRTADADAVTALVTDLVAKAKAGTLEVKHSTDLPKS